MPAEVELKKCRALWASVLTRALEDACYAGESAPELMAADKARRFIDKRTGNFDFACHVLGLDPEKTSKRMEWEYHWKLNGGD